MSVEVELEGIWSVMEQIRGSYSADMNKSINYAAYRALTAGRKALAVGIRGEYNIKSGRIKAATKLKRPSEAFGEASLIVSGRPIDLSEFAPKVSKKGVLSVRVTKTRKKINHSFFVVSKGGIYHRVTKECLPIKREYTLSVPQMAGNVNVANKAQERMVEVFEDRLKKALMYGGEK